MRDTLKITTERKVFNYEEFKIVDEYRIIYCAQWM